MEDIFANVEKMGRVIGEEAKARSLIARARERLRAIRSRVPRNAKPPRVLALLGGGWTPGGRTSQDAMIRLAGGENAAAKGGVRGTRRVSAEQALAWNPDVLVVGADPKSGASLKTMLRESANIRPPAEQEDHRDSLSPLLERVPLHRSRNRGFGEGAPSMKKRAVLAGTAAAALLIAALGVRLGAADIGWSRILEIILAETGLPLPRGDRRSRPRAGHHLAHPASPGR